jgi:hypothetical protein
MRTVHFQMRNDFAPSEQKNSELLLDEIACRISKCQHTAREALYEIGALLHQAQNTVPSGKFRQFLRDTRVGFTPRMAEIYMRVAEATDGRQLAQYGIAKATILLRLPLKERGSFVQGHEINRITAGLLRRMIAEIIGGTSGASAARPGAGDAYTKGWNEGYAEGQADISRVAWAVGVLQIRPPLSKSLIEKAFRELSQILHPDKGFTDDTKFMRTLLEARNILNQAAAQSTRDQFDSGSGAA